MGYRQVRDVRMGLHRLRDTKTHPLDTWNDQRCLYEHDCYGRVRDVDNRFSCTICSSQLRSAHRNMGSIGRSRSHFQTWTKAPLMDMKDLIRLHYAAPRLHTSRKRHAVRNVSHLLRNKRAPLAGRRDYRQRCNALADTRLPQDERGYPPDKRAFRQ